MCVCFARTQRYMYLTLPLINFHSLSFCFILLFFFFLKVEIVLMFVGGLRTKKEDYHKLSNWEPRAKLHDVMHPMLYSFGYIMLSGFLFQQNKNNAK